MTQWRQILSWDRTSDKASVYIPTMDEKVNYVASGVKGFQRFMTAQMEIELCKLGFSGARKPQIFTHVERESQGPMVGEGDSYFGEVQLLGSYALIESIVEVLSKIENIYFLTDADDFPVTIQEEN